MSGLGRLESPAWSGAGLHFHRADHGDGQQDPHRQGGGGAQSVRQAAALENKVRALIKILFFKTNIIMIIILTRLKV